MLNTTPSQPAGFEGGQYLGALTKKCPKCGEEKPTSAFGKFHRGPGGLNHKCLACSREQGKSWRDAHKEREIIRCAEYRKSNPEKRKETTKNYRDANKESIRVQGLVYRRRPEVQTAEVERNRRRYLEKGDQMRASNKRWADANPDRVLAKGARWARNHPEKVIAKCARRRKHVRTPAWADNLLIQAVYAESRRLTRLTGIPHQVDHIYPIRSSSVSGLHVHSNLRAVPATLNRLKKNKFPGFLAHELWDPYGPDVFHEESTNG